MKFKKVTIKGVGSYLPDRIVKNRDLVTSKHFKGKNNKTTPQWIESALGIKERRVANEMSTSDLGVKASREALYDANLDKNNLDMIIAVTSSPEKISPTTASIIHSKLGIEKNIPIFDVNAVCSGFVYALTLASSFVHSGMCKNILVVACEKYSAITDYDNRNCVFFGDGAGAVIVGDSKKGWISSILSGNGSNTGQTGFTLEHNSKFDMKGNEVWNQAIKVLPGSILNLMNENDLTHEDIKMFIPHQASITLLKQIFNHIGVPFNKVKTVMDRYANIAGASIPIALTEAITRKQIVHGDKILLTAIGAGWSWGSIIINYEK